MSQRGTKKCDFDFCHRRVSPSAIKEKEVWCQTHRIRIAFAKKTLEALSVELAKEGLSLSDILKMKP